MSDEQPKANPERGYRLNFNPMSGELTHDFCGSHDIQGATCPHCNKPLLRIISLDAKDRSLNLNPKKTPLVHLLYCWTCSIPFGEFAYKVTPNASVELIRVPERYQYEFGPDGPYEGYTGVYPLSKVSLESLNEDAVSTARESNDSFDEWHQIGGTPLISNPDDRACPTCSKPMPLLAVFCDDAAGNDPFKRQESNSFAGNGSVQMVFHFCSDCAIVSAYHSCD